MKSFTESVALLQKMGKISTTDTTNTGLITQFWNDSIRTVCNIRNGKWPFLETTEDVDTVANQSAYAIPATIRKLINIYVTVGSGSTAVKYLPIPIFDDNKWNLILASRLAASDIPRFYRVTGNNKIEIQPTPATSSNVITFRGRTSVIDLSIADYTTGTVSGITNGDVAVTGSGTTWTAAMAGRYLRITNSDTANKGDGRWYKILSYSSATSITLFAPYEGTTITAGAAAYTIGQMSPIPEPYDTAPVYRALALYAQINDPLHPAVAQGWWKLYDGGQEAGLIKGPPEGLIGQMLENYGETVEGAYIEPNGINWPLDPNCPPYNLTGF